VAPSPRPSSFRDRKLLEGIAGGPLGKIVVTLFTWSDWHIQEMLIPWMRIDGAGLFGRGYEGTRKVVDISGDGVNKSGRPVADARADALGKGIILNGLAVLDRTPTPWAAGLPPLDDYYRDEVIGGPGAFLMVAEGFEAFEQAVKRKIIREIAAAPPPGPQVERALA
jgi:hypothetical protein